MIDNFKEIEIEVMLNKSLKGKAPPEWGKKDWQRYYINFKRTKLTPYQLAAMIWQGYSFTPVYRNGRRLEDNFEAAYHIAFDLDSEGAALDTLMANGSISWLFSSFAYSTPSSTKDHPKSRVVFILPEPILDAQTMRQLYLALAWEFNQEGSVTDRACKDSLRLYYGSENCEVRTNWSALLPETVEFLINRYEENNPLPKPVIDNTTITLPSSDIYIESRINKLLNQIVYAPDGEKHNTLNKIAYTLGGMVAGGHLSLFEAESKLEAAITSNGRAKDLDSAKRTIKESLAKGQVDPIIIEQKYKKNLDEIL